MITTIPRTTAETTSAVRAAPLPPLTVRPVDRAADISAWAEYVERTPQGTLFHHPDWCVPVAATFGHRPCHLLAVRGARVVGVLPLFEVRSFLAGRLFVSVPYGTYGGILAHDDGASRGLARAAAELATTGGGRMLELRSTVAGVADFDDLPGYVRFVRDLPANVEDVPAFFPKRARAAARHARDRDGLTITHDRNHLPIVWDLYSRSMRRLASLNYPRRFFEQLAERLGPRAWVSVGWLSGRPIVGTLSFIFGDTLMPYVLGADERVRCDGAANLLYWNIMERAVAAGVTRFDYGRSRADNHGAVGFKKNQGFEPQPLGYQRFVPKGQTAPNLKPSNPRYALARRVWRHLPLALTRGLGTWLAHSIPG